MRAGSPPCRTAPSRRPTCSRPRPASSRSASASRSPGTRSSFDFAGTAPQHDGNLNCPLSVTRSACYFVVRCLTAPDLPSSGGAFAPVTVRRARGLARQRPAPAAVAAGNVETSCRIVDVLLRALGDAVPCRPGPGDDEQRHARQRALHVLRDDRRRPGRLPDADGPSGVHVTMSNTLTTPTEALELAYPLRVERHALRLGSGGAGPAAAATASSASCACSSRAGSRSSPSDARTPRAAPRRRTGDARAQPPQRRETPREGDARPGGRRHRHDRDAGRRRLSALRRSDAELRRDPPLEQKRTAARRARTDRGNRPQGVRRGAWRMNPADVGPITKPISQESVESAM